jgi:hypothetical protein
MNNKKIKLKKSTAIKTLVARKIYERKWGWILKWLKKPPDCDVVLIPVKGREKEGRWKVLASGLKTMLSRSKELLNL